MTKTATKRTTVYLEDDLHRALRLKAAEVERSMSDLVNEALRRSLAEDADDLAAFEERAGQKSLPFEKASARRSPARSRRPRRKPPLLVLA